MTEPPRKSHPLEFPTKSNHGGNGDAPGDETTDAQRPKITQHTDEQQIRQFITPLKTFEQQVGEHVIRALRAQDTVAVISAVVIGGDGQQRIVSAALDPDMMAQVQQLLGDAAEQREEEVPCLGFHCYIERKAKDKKKKKRTKKKSRGSKKK